MESGDLHLTTRAERHSHRKHHTDYQLYHELLKPSAVHSADVDTAAAAVSLKRSKIRHRRVAGDPSTSQRRHQYSIGRHHRSTPIYTNQNVGASYTPSSHFQHHHRHRRRVLSPPVGDVAQTLSAAALVSKYRTAAANDPIRAIPAHQERHHHKSFWRRTRHKIAKVLSFERVHITLRQALSAGASSMSLKKPPQNTTINLKSKLKAREARLLPLTKDETKRLENITHKQKSSLTRRHHWSHDERYIAPPRNAATRSSIWRRNRRTTLNVDVTSASTTSGESLTPVAVTDSGDDQHGAHDDFLSRSTTLSNVGLKTAAEYLLLSSAPSAFLQQKRTNYHLKWHSAKRKIIDAHHKPLVAATGATAKTNFESNTKNSTAAPLTDKLAAPTTPHRMAPRAPVLRGAATYQPRRRSAVWDNIDRGSVHSKVSVDTLGWAHLDKTSLQCVQVEIQFHRNVGCNFTPHYRSVAAGTVFSSITPTKPAADRNYNKRQNVNNNREFGCQADGVLADQEELELRLGTIDAQQRQLRHTSARALLLLHKCRSQASLARTIQLQHRLIPLTTPPTTSLLAIQQSAMNMLAKKPPAAVENLGPFDVEISEQKSSTTSHLTFVADDSAKPTSYDHHSSSINVASNAVVPLTAVTSTMSIQKQRVRPLSATVSEVSFCDETAFSSTGNSSTTIISAMLQQTSLSSTTNVTESSSSSFLGPSHGGSHSVSPLSLSSSLMERRQQMLAAAASASGSSRPENNSHFSSDLDQQHHRPLSGLTTTSQQSKPLSSLDSSAFEIQQQHLTLQNNNNNNKSATLTTDNLYESIALFLDGERDRWYRLALSRPQLAPQHVERLLVIHDRLMLTTQAMGEFVREIPTILTYQASSSFESGDYIQQQQHATVLANVKQSAVQKGSNNSGAVVSKNYDAARAVSEPVIIGSVDESVVSYASSDIYEPAPEAVAAVLTSNEHDRFDSSTRPVSAGNVLLTMTVQPDVDSDGRNIQQAAVFPHDELPEKSKPSKDEDLQVSLSAVDDVDNAEVINLIGAAANELRRLTERLDQSLAL